MSFINPFAAPLAADQLARIDRAARHILQHIGMDVQHDGVVERLRTAGAGSGPAPHCITMTPAWLDDMLARAPRHFTLCARNGHPDLEMGSGNIHFSNGARVFRMLDTISGTSRTTTLLDVARQAAMVENLSHLHIYMIACQASDVPDQYYHLNDYFHALKNTGKHVMGGYGAENGLQHMWQIATAVAGGP